MEESKFKPDWVGERNETTKPSQFLGLSRDSQRGPSTCGGLESGFYCVTQAGLELTVLTRLILVYTNHTLYRT